MKKISDIIIHIVLICFIILGIYTWININYIFIYDLYKTNEKTIFITILLVTIINIIIYCMFFSKRKIINKKNKNV